MELKIGLIGTFSSWSLGSPYRESPTVFFMTNSTFGFVTYGTWLSEILTSLRQYQATLKILSSF